MILTFCLFGAFWQSDFVKFDDSGINFIPTLLVKIRLIRNLSLVVAARRLSQIQVRPLGIQLELIGASHDGPVHGRFSSARLVTIRPKQLF